MKKIGRNDPCWCGSGRKYKVCHEEFDRKIEMIRNQGHIVPSHKIIKTPEQIQGIRESAKVNIECLDVVSEKICAGMSTEDINRIINEVCAKHGAIPAPLNYEGYPKSVCTSINDVVCHGIPSENEILMDGDIINVDCSTILNGYFSDSSRMFLIGNVAEEHKRLVEVTRKSIQAGLEQVKPWGFLGDMGEAVHNVVKEAGYSVVREIGGHGIGLEFHEDPWVGYTTRRGTDMLMVPGMIFTIEPMVNMGAPDVFCDEEDGWTIYTEDGSYSAQEELQVLVTETGYEVIAY